MARRLAFPHTGLHHAHPRAQAGAAGCAPNRHPRRRTLQDGQVRHFPPHQATHASLALAHRARLLCFACRAARPLAALYFIRRAECHAGGRRTSSAFSPRVNPAWTCINSSDRQRLAVQTHRRQLRRCEGAHEPSTSTGVKLARRACIYISERTVSTHTVAALHVFTTVVASRTSTSQLLPLLTPWGATQVRQGRMHMPLAPLPGRSYANAIVLRRASTVMHASNFDRCMTQQLHVSAYQLPTERLSMHAVAFTDASMGFGSPVHRVKDAAVTCVPAEELLGAGFRSTRSSTRYACPPLPPVAWGLENQRSRLKPQRVGFPSARRKANNMLLDLDDPTPPAATKGKGKAVHSPPPKTHHQKKADGSVSHLLLPRARSSTHAEHLSYTPHVCIQA